jgi:hypothetical protein
MVRFNILCGNVGGMCGDVVEIVEMLWRCCGDVAVIMRRYCGDIVEVLWRCCQGVV